MPRLFSSLLALVLLSCISPASIGEWSLPDFDLILADYPVLSAAEIDNLANLIAQNEDRPATGQDFTKAEGMVYESLRKLQRLKLLIYSYHDHLDQQKLADVNLAYLEWHYDITRLPLNLSTLKSMNAIRRRETRLERTLSDLESSIRSKPFGDPVTRPRNVRPFHGPDEAENEPLTRLASLQISSELKKRLVQDMGSLLFAPRNLAKARIENESRAAVIDRLLLNDEDPNLQEIGGYYRDNNLIANISTPYIDMSALYYDRKINPSSTTFPIGKNDYDQAVSNSKKNLNIDVDSIPSNLGNLNALIALAPFEESLVNQEFFVGSIAIANNDPVEEAPFLIANTFNITDQEVALAFNKRPVFSDPATEFPVDRAVVFLPDNSLETQAPGTDSILTLLPYTPKPEHQPSPQPEQSQSVIGTPPIAVRKDRLSHNEPATDDVDDPSDTINEKSDAPRDDDKISNDFEYTSPSSIPDNRLDDDLDEFQAPVTLAMDKPNDRLVDDLQDFVTIPGTRAPDQYVTRSQEPGQEYSAPKPQLTDKAVSRPVDDVDGFRTPVTLAIDEASDRLVDDQQDFATIPGTRAPDQYVIRSQEPGQEYYAPKTQLAVESTILDQNKYVNGTQTGSPFPIASDHQRHSVQTEKNWSRLNFSFNSAELSPNAMQFLDVLVDRFKLLKANNNVRLVVSGYSDTAGSQAYNKILSQQRSESVRTYLNSHGVDNNDIALHAFGEQHSLVSTNDGVSSQENRRVDVIVGYHPGQSHSI